MKITPKIILGVSILTLFILVSFFIIFLNISKRNQNWIFLESANNKFKVNFQISPKNQPNFKSVLKLLNLPLNTQNGIEFKLDATPSAQLAYISPIKSSIKLSSKSVAFDGTLSYLQSINEKTPQSIKAPSSTVFAIYAPDFNTFLKKKYQFTQDQKNWLDENFVSSNGQYLTIFAPQDFAIYFENNKINLDGVNSINNETFGESTPSQDLSNNIKTYTLNAFGNNNKEPLSIILFRTGKWNVITSSLEAAQTIENVQHAQSSILNFAQAAKNSPASFILLFQNKENNLTKELISTLINITDPNNLNEAKLRGVLYNVSQASFVLKQEHFSGLIKFK